MLSSSRLVLRCLERQDLELIARWRNRPEIRTMFFHKQLISLSRQAAWYERYAGDSSKELFIAELKGNGEPIGMIGLSHIDLSNRKAEVGNTMIGDPQEWGKGYGVEMLNCLLEYCFTDLGLNRVYAYAIDINQASVKTKQKCGFLVEGTLREDHYMNGRYHDVYIMGLTRGDWMKR